MPKTTKRGAAKAKAQRSAAKSKAKPATKSKAPGRAKSRPAKSTNRKGSAIDPRILAAIGLALEDERIATDRAELLTQPLSTWVTSGRVRVSAR